MKALTQRYNTIRSYSLALIEGLSEADCSVQSMPDASPTKWHLAHTSWFFETFVLEPFVTGYQAFNPGFRALFNSYYESVGAQYPRPKRGLITRPDLRMVLAYRAFIDDKISHMLSIGDLPNTVLAMIELGLHHEQQHQELMVMDIKHLFFQNPMKPAFITTPLQSALIPRSGDAHLRGWLDFEGGLIDIGAHTDHFSFDNERPRHHHYQSPFRLARSLVTNQEYLQFILDDGYHRPDLWLSDGWHWLKSNAVSQPLYWELRDGHWFEFTLNGQSSLDLSVPVTHLSFYEADAFARWAGARLPTETEWEWAVSSIAPDQLSHCFDLAWQWTASPYTPYPGFQVADGAIGEYNGKFMINQMVLRGGSLATPKGHSRSTYRNFFPPSARWQFSGIRLAQHMEPLEIMSSEKSA